MNKKPETIEIKTPQANIIGNAAYLVRHFERIENGWIAYKIFNSSYPAPKSWKIEAGSIITDDGLDTDPEESCSWGINVAKNIDWIADFISTEDEDCYGNTSADVWKMFIPDTATIVIPNDTDGKIRVNQAQLIAIVGEVCYRGGDWDKDDYEFEDYEFEDYEFDGDEF